MAEKGDFEELMKYSGQTGTTPDFMFLLQSMMMNNQEGAVALAKMISKQPNPPIEINTITDLFLQRNMVSCACSWACPRYLLHLAQRSVSFVCLPDWMHCILLMLFIKIDHDIRPSVQGARKGMAKPQSDLL